MFAGTGNIDESSNVLVSPSRNVNHCSVFQLISSGLQVKLIADLPTKGLSHLDFDNAGEINILEQCCYMYPKN